VDSHTIIDLIKSVGFPIALVVYLLIRDRGDRATEVEEKRELIGRVQSLEEELRGSSEQHAAQYERLASENKQALENNTKWVQHLCDMMKHHFMGPMHHPVTPPESVPVDPHAPYEHPPVYRRQPSEH